MYRHQNSRGRPSTPLGYGHYARTMFPSNALNFPATHRDIDYNNTHGYDKIFFAVHQGNLNLAHNLLKDNSEERELLGRTLMHVAAARGHEQIVCLLCHRNFRIDKGDRDGNSPLHLAIKANYFDLVQLLVKENTVNLTNSVKETPLHIATANSQIEIVEFLLKNGANPNEQDARGKTPLHLAVTRRRPILKIITLLMEHEASGDVLCDALQTPLYLAVLSGNIGVIKILIKHGARIDAINIGEMTPLILSIQKNSIEIVRELLNTKHREDFEGTTMTPLHYAAKNGNQEIVKLLITNGDNTLNTKNEDFRTPLYFASVNNHLETVKYLIENGSKIESATPEDESLLHLCAKNGRMEILKCLIACGAVIDVKNYRHETPLHFAASNGHLDILKYLLECNADFHAKTLDNETPLYLAVKARHEKIVESLLIHGGTINFLADEDCSALTFAVKSRKKKIVQLFLSKGARDYETDTEDGERAVHVAAKNGDEEIIRLLLQAGCSLNINCKGKKPIHVAAIFGHVKALELFVKNGVDVNSRKRFEETPLHLAAASGRVAAVKYLLDAGADPKSLTDRGLPPLEYVLDRGRHMAIMQRRTTDSFRSRTTFTDASDLSAIWPVNSVMFEKYFAITEMLLIKCGLTFANYSLLHHMRHFSSTCIYRACQMRVLQENSTSNPMSTSKARESTSTTEFKPDIVRCILNYATELERQEFRFRSNISTTVLRKSPEILKCLLEYDIHKLDIHFKIDCEEFDNKIVLILVDHIVDSKVIYGLLYSSQVQLDVRRFRESFRTEGERLRSRIERASEPFRISAQLDLHSSLSENLILNRNTYVDTLKLLIARLVLLRAISKEDNAPEPKEIKILETYGLSDWYTQCEIQIMNARETKIHDEFDVTYYNFLAQSVSKISNYVRQKELLKILEMTCMKFPAYGEFLKRSIEKGKERKELIDASGDCLLNVINKNHKIQLPSLVVDRIFDYLSVIDLRKLQQAGRFVDKKLMYERRKPFFEKKKPFYEKNNSSRPCFTKRRSNN